MPGRSASQRRALEAVERPVMATFAAAGFEHIAPDVLQPADIFLERSGEDIRSQTYVFTDPAGAEMCLRPDLTVPACRYHLTHAGRPDTEARYCYCGPAFRYTGETNETPQAGLEWFGGSAPETQEAAVLQLACAAVEAAGICAYRVETGDLALFRALIDDFEIPERWRRRLKHHFWRPQAFRDVLASISGDAIRLRNSASAHVDTLAGDATAFVEQRLAAFGLPLVGGRSAAEIAARLAEKAADRSERPLSRAEATRIEDYLAISGTPEAAGHAFAALEHGSRFEAASARFARRGKLLAETPQRFSATFGRSLEYYTGFVFQIETDGPDGPVQVAGGGRYDDLLSDIGAGLSVPAVGCALFPGRIAAVLA